MVKNNSKYPKIAETADAYGVHGINIFGDSIAHGSGAPIIYEESYAGIIRNTINDVYKGDNYGYASIMSTLWPGGKLRCSEIHEIMLSQKEGGYSLEHDDIHWSRMLCGNHIGGCSMVSQVNGAEMKITLARSFKYVCVYYISGGDKGTFDLTASGDILLSVDCGGEKTEEKRTGYIDISKYGTDTPLLLINTSSDKSKEIKITGFAYYNDPDMFTVNNYSLGGRCFHYQSQKVLEEACCTSTLIFALGYNDATFCQDEKESFSRNIDTVIREISKNGTRLYVVDCCWNYPADNHFRRELSRLAKETGGVLIDMTVDMNRREELFVDGVHPTAEGHRIIADKVLKAMNIQQNAD